MELTHDDVKKILEIIDASEHLQDLELVYGCFRLHVHRGNASGAAMSTEHRLANEGPAASAAASPAAAGVSPALPKQSAEPNLPRARSQSEPRCWAPSTGRLLPA